MAENNDLAFHRKYRAARIADYIGNDRMKQSIMAALKDNRRPQIIMMTGHAGCGKTTMARLLAKEYLCEDRDDVIGACGVCHNCKLLEEYIETGNADMLMSVREIDIADNNRKQDIDEILEEAAVPTYDGSWRVYVLDEAHMASASAQNRLLKITEEPPERVLIILCTTDPEKIIGTIHSRAQYTFKVSKPTRDELAGLLAKVCKKEGVNYDARSLSLICAKTEFTPRKALIKLQSVITEQGDVTYSNTVKALDVIADTFFFEFLNLLLDKVVSIGRYVTFIGRVKERMELKTFVGNLVDFINRGIYINYGVRVEALDESEIKQYEKLFKKFTPLELEILLDELLNMKNSLDIESKLLLLGYKGIKRKVKNGGTFDTSMLDMGYLVDTSTIDVNTEKRVGNDNYQESITMNDEEKQTIVQERSSLVTTDDILNLLGATKITKT